jgi:hypothetical protein
VKTPRQPRPLLLKDLIAQLRREITEAVDQRVADGHDPLFTLKSVDLEVNFVVEQEESMEGSASATFLAVVGLKAGASSKYSAGQIQKVTLHLSTYQEAGVQPPFVQLQKPFQFPTQDWAEIVGQSNEPGIHLNDYKICNIPGVSGTIKVSEFFKRIEDEVKVASPSETPMISWERLTAPADLG